MTTSRMRPPRISSSTETRTSPVCQRANTENVAKKYDAFANRLFDSFTRFAIAPLIPALATFAK